MKLPVIGMVLAGVAFAAPGHAQQPVRRAAPVAASASALVLEVGAGRVIALHQAAASIFAADPKIVEVRPASSTSLFVFGVGVGRTTIAALDAGGSPVAQFDVVVHPSSGEAQEVAGTIARNAPGSQVRAEGRADGFTLSGPVISPEQALNALNTARLTAGDKDKVENRLTLQGQPQVNLRVRIAEMSRSLTRSLGIDWSAVGRIGQNFAIGIGTQNLASVASAPTTLGLSRTGKADVNAIIDALSQDSLVRVLAEPNLTAMSGEAASFIVGGEFPIPVASNNNTVTVDFKQYGISLAFVPTVLDDGQINLKVRPEVSELSTQGAVTLSASNAAFQIPALTVRRAETTVMLGSGESFAIAGLLEDSITHSTNAVPGLGDVPVVGSLFRADSLVRDEVELVIIVTPYIVRPASSPSALQLPTDGYRLPTDFERIVLLRQLGRSDGTAGSKLLPGSAGFVLQ